GVRPGAPEGWTKEPRRFTGASNITVYQRTLYVADKQGARLQVFDLATLVLVRMHTGIEVVDVAAGAQGVYVVDRAARVYRPTPGSADETVDRGLAHLRDPSGDERGSRLSHGRPSPPPVRPAGR